MDDLRYQIDMLTARTKTYAANEKIYKLIVQASNRVFIYFNPETGLLKSYGHWNDYFDFVLNDFSDLSRVLDIFKEEDRDEISELFYIDKKGLSEAAFTAHLPSSDKVVEITVNVIYSETGSVTDKLFTIHDITKRYKLQDNLSYLAYYDLMTNLLNRNSYIERLNKFLIKAEEESAIVSVLMINIDDFHKINDTMGIIYGDEVIQQLGLYLNELTCDNVIGARFDGDIYSIAIYNPAGQTSVENIYAKIKERLQSPFILTNGAEVYVTLSIGVAEYPEAASKALELCTCGEIVMLKVKSAGKNDIRYCDSNILNEFKKTIVIENKLKDAVHNMDFYLNFQPQYDSTTKKLRGVEALIRWKDQDGNIIPPSEFIPLSEKIGYIIPIGDFVLGTAISTFMDWKKKYDIDLVMSVNISSIQFKQPDFVNKVISQVKRFDMNPSNLELEITESILIDDTETVFDKIAELRDFGIKISIDDFGTGYSSLSYLKKLPADTLKIDKSFVDTLTSDEATRIIVHSISEMAKKLGFETVAEGVETENQFDYLKEIGCDMIQGYYLGKPVSLEAMEDILLRLL